mmetsp:Transcript_23072/g.41565  ORF Transcript_23072/g.41565 Transcript_23072/m.41565 type:complete len:91 (-) Transcript_23072:182-454(-)
MCQHVTNTLVSPVSPARQATSLTALSEKQNTQNVFSTPDLHARKTCQSCIWKRVLQQKTTEVYLIPKIYTCRQRATLQKWYTKQKGDLNT